MLSICFAWLFYFIGWCECIPAIGMHAFIERKFNDAESFDGERRSRDENVSYALNFHFCSAFLFCIRLERTLNSMASENEITLCACMARKCMVFLLYLHFNISYIYMCWWRRSCRRRRRQHHVCYSFRAWNLLILLRKFANDKQRAKELFRWNQTTACVWESSQSG